MTGFICGPRLYEYDGLTIDIPGIGGPCPVKSNGEPYQRCPRGIAETMDRFCALSDEERETYRVGGGCRRIEG